MNFTLLKINFRFFHCELLSNIRLRWLVCSKVMKHFSQHRQITSISYNFSLTTSACFTHSLHKIKTCFIFKHHTYQITVAKLTLNPCKRTLYFTFSSVSHKRKIVKNDKKTKNKCFSRYY